MAQDKGDRRGPGVTTIHTHKNRRKHNYDEQHSSTGELWQVIMVVAPITILNNPPKLVLKKIRT